MPNADRINKRKADLLSECAVKCRKLSDLLQSQRQESIHSVTVMSQNAEAANQSNTTSQSSITVMSLDNKAIQSLSSLTDANQAQPSAVTVSMTTVAEHVADTSELCSAHDGVTKAAAVMSTCELAAKESKIEKKEKKKCFFLQRNKI